MAQAPAFDIETHKHRAAAWAAARAGSVTRKRYSVERGRSVLEAVGLTATIAHPSQLPLPCDIDNSHRHWRRLAIAAAAELGLDFTHGMAAKLINCYLKYRFVCGGHHDHPSVAALHPPIDDLLLKELADRKFGGSDEIWKTARSRRWSNFDSDHYERVISEIRTSLMGAPLWTIEEHWKGFQSAPNSSLPRRPA